jgi:hypothetical protein
MFNLTKIRAPFKETNSFLFLQGPDKVVVNWNSIP